MGCVGVNGKIKLSDGHKGCILFMDNQNGNVIYNNGFCLFPLVGAAVVAGLTFIFFIIWSVIISRREEVSAKAISITFMVFMTACALLSFAICAEVGIGLNKGCNILPDDQRHNCRHRGKFNALWAAEICAGISGGFLIIALVLEVFQFMLPAHYSSSTSRVANSSNYKVPALNSAVTSSHIQHPTTIEADQPQMNQPNQYLSPHYQPQTPYRMQAGDGTPAVNAYPQSMPAAAGTPVFDTYPQRMPVAPRTPVVNITPAPNSPYMGRS
ncbi:hypothetical protein BGX27_003266 [Mortierella sp. AM989]|nr:hypothetical protein BGX27_003266 [Mortierella sp. AM989]